MTQAFTITLPQRLRRNRKSPAIRALLQENRLHPNHFVAPLFIIEGENQREDIPSMPGIYRLSLDLAIRECVELYMLGVVAVDLFTVIPKERKDRYGSEAIRSGNLIQTAARTLKQEIPEMCIMVDVALDPFTDHGHDGIVDDEGRIVNDPTLNTLAEMSLLLADAGADVVAPSDMMDGRVGYIRQQLDASGFQEVNILSYAAKYASAFYGPFRDALHSAPKFGDKNTYQLNPANSREALLEARTDEWENADMLLIKPALPYLDIVAKIREMTHLPIGAYHVSGEYAMVMAAAKNGWIDGERVMIESLMAIKRAGADFIFTYAAKSVASYLSSR